MIHIIILLLIMIIYTSYCKGLKPICPKIKLEDLFSMKKFKTGDMIFFIHHNSITPYCFATQFSHVALVYVDPNKKEYKPKIFEINMIYRSNYINLSHINQINLTDLYYRMLAYKGTLYYKELNKEVNIKYIKNFRNFLIFAKNNFRYEVFTPFMVLAKKIFQDKSNFSVNCADLVYYCLIKLNILPYKKKINNKFHSLKYLLNLENTNNNNYKYKKLIEIIVLDY